jgi:hypothetical protein
VIVTNDQQPPEDEVIGHHCGGSYVITSVLGVGGMGAVYLATSEMLAGKAAAVKVLLPELTRRSEGLARFRAEVYAAGKIDDPNIVKVFDAGELDNGRLYMMMEFCADGSLEALLNKCGALSFELIVTIACSIGSALHTAHTEAKITHRDIKPANILLVQEPGGLLRAKLADFGIAKLHDEQLAFAMRTGTKKILGSPGYMAAEQCTGSAGVDSRADVYAFGSVLYEMVTGRRPYLGDSLYELISNVVSNAPFPLPGQLRRDLPPGWEAVIMGCLAQRREDRIQTVKEAVRRLARAIPNGESLMSYVAPRLVDTMVAPTAVTISDGIGPAVTQWADAHSALGARRNLPFARALAVLVSGAVLGVGVTAIVVHSRAPIANTAPDDAKQREVIDRQRIDSDRPRAAAVATPGDSSVPPFAAPRADAVEVAHVVLQPVDGGVDAARIAAVSVDAGVDAARITAAPVDAGIDAMRALAATSDSDKPQRAVEKRTVQAPAQVQRGALRVEVEPWADVAVSGEKDTYTTPVTITLSAGHHRVVLTKGAQKETIDVTITPNETTRIARSW